jgi:hypothetical protein
MVCQVRRFLLGTINKLVLTYPPFARPQYSAKLSHDICQLPLQSVLPMVYHTLRQVIHTQLLKLHASLRNAKSLDEMIQVHGAQYGFHYINIECPSYPSRLP